jgi:hypothetical protein
MSSTVIHEIRPTGPLKIATGNAGAVDQVMSGMPI